MSAAMISGPIVALSLAWLAPVVEGERARPASTFPEMTISRDAAEHEWPFAIDEGRLTCVSFDRQRFVFFAEILTAEEMGEFGNMTLPRSVVVSANPMSYFATFENRELYLPWDSLETLIKRLAPYERMGWALCDADEAKSPGDQSKEN